MAMEEFKEGRQLKYGFNEADSGTFKTAADDTDTFTQVSCEHFDVDRGLESHDIPGAHGTRQKVHANTITTTKGAMGKFTVTGPASIFEMDQYLYAFSQLTAEAAGSPFTKIFTPFATHPDFSASAGHFLTWAVGFPVNTTSWKMTSCICSRLKFMIERGGFLQFEADFISPEAPSVVSAVYESGTWEVGLDGPGGADASADFYGYKHWSDLTRIQMDTDATPSPLAEGVVFHALEVELGREVEGIHPDGTGGFNNLGLSGLFGNYSLTIQKDSVAEGALTAQSGNSAMSIVLGWGAAGALVDKEVEMTLRGKFNPDGWAVDKEGLNKAVLSGTLSRANDLSNDMFDIRMANDIDRAWPA